MTTSLQPTLCILSLSALFSSIWITPTAHAQEFTPKREGTLVSFGLGPGGCLGGRGEDPCANQVQPGLGAVLAVGYRMGSFVAFDLSYHENLLNPERDESIDLTYSLTALGMRVYPLHKGMIDPYITAGVGLFSLTSSFQTQEFTVEGPDGETIDLSNKTIRVDSSGSAWYLGLGTHYFLTPSISLGLYGRYLFAPQLDEVCLRVEGSNFCTDTSNNDQSDNASYWSTTVTADFYVF